MLILLTTLALLFLLFGSYLLSRGIYVWDAGLFVLLSVIVLSVLALLRSSGRSRLFDRLPDLIPKSIVGRRVAGMRISALIASLGVALVARHRAPETSFTMLFVVWLLSLAVFCGSLWMSAWERIRSGSGSQAPVWQRIQSLGAPWEWWALGLLLVVAGLLRGVALDRVPANLGGDEGTQLTAALNLVGEGRTGAGMGNPFATGWYSVPTMSFVVYGLAMRVFGATVAGGRVLSALAGTVTVLTTYAVGRAMGGRRIGWVAALILAFSAYHIHYSRLASNQIFDPLIGTLAMGLVWRALRARQMAGPSGDAVGLSAWGLAGVIAGFGWYAYFGARWISFVIALTVAVWFLTDRSLLRRHWRGLLLFGLGWLIAVLPLLGWYSVSPSSLSERYRAVSIFESGWLEREVVITGLPAFRLLMRQAWRAVTAFHLTPDPTFWYRPERPLVDFITGALLLLGLVDATLRLHWPSRRLMHLWFWSTLVMAWVVTENPPSSQRGLLLIPAVAVFAAWGLQRAGSLLRLGRRHYQILLVAALLVIAVLNTGFYFVDYVPRRVYGNPTAETAMVLADYVLAHPEPVCPVDPTLACAGRVYVLGPPWFYWDFGSLAFMLRRFPGESVPLDSFVDNAAGPARFIVVPERITEMEMLRQHYPGGTEMALHGVNDALLALIYDWPGAQAP